MSLPIPSRPAALLAALALLALGAAAPAAAEDAAKPPTDDDALAARIESQLERAGMVEQDVTVRVEEGVVTLQGHVPTPHDRERAVALARGTEGVKEVVDDLAVGDLDPDTLPPVGSDVPNVQ